MDVWSQNEEKTTRVEQTNQGWIPCRYLGAIWTKKKTFIFLYQKTAQRYVSFFCFFYILLRVVCKDGPLIFFFFFYVVAVAFLARIQPLTSHYVSVHTSESYCSLLWWVCFRKWVFVFILIFTFLSLNSSLNPFALHFHITRTVIFQCWKTSKRVHRTETSCHQNSWFSFSSTWWKEINHAVFFSIFFNFSNDIYINKSKVWYNKRNRFWREDTKLKFKSPSSSSEVFGCSYLRKNFFFKP